MKKICFFIFVVIIVFSCGRPWGQNSRVFQFTYEVEIESSEGKKLELWLPIPQSNEVQKISNLIVNTEGIPYNIKDESKHGNKYVYIYALEGIDETKKISMNFDVIRNEHSNVEYKGVIPSNYIKPSSMVPTGNIFSSIIEDNQLKHEISKITEMRNIYDYVLSGMHYGKPKSVKDKYYKKPWLNSLDKYGMKKVTRDDVVDLYKKAKQTHGSYTFGNGNSLYACDIGVGNCTDYHSYFMSLSRTLNTPARFHMGFPIPVGKEGNVEGYHCWADYYVEGEGWSPVDISEADKNPGKEDYFFGTVCNNRLEMMVGRDFKLQGYELEVVNFFIYPLMEIDDQRSDAFRKTFKYKNL